MNVRAVLLLAFAAHVVHARGPADAPALPPPAQASIVMVDTAQELADACWNLTSNRAIVIAPGDYNLASVTFPNGVDGRLTVGRFGSPIISNIEIRGATGNPADVRLHGAGMLDDTVPFGFQFFTATDVTIADLSIDAVYYHAIMVQAPSARVRLYHLRLFDIGQQIVKGTPNADDVTVEYSELFYTSGAPIHPDGSPANSCYTNAVDGVTTDRWIVRDNLIRGIRCQDNTLAGPAVLLWQGSMDGLVERNTIVDSSRGVSLGLISATDHVRGIVRNNMIRWNPNATYAIDVPIYVASSNAKVLHNSVVTAGEYPNAIEIRFTGANNEVRNNVLDAIVLPRNGAVPVQSGNVTTAQLAWFVDAASGNLHLTPAATPALDQTTRLVDATEDFDAELRPDTGVDLGADEAGAPVLLFRDGFEVL